MKTVEIPEYLCGTQHVNLPSELSASYEELFAVVKSQFPDMELSKFLPMCGKYYGEKLQWSRAMPFDGFEELSEEEQKKYLEPAVKLMVVGRSVNGWAEMDEPDSRSFVASAAQEITAFQGFSWLGDDGRAKNTYSIDGKTRRYSVNRSAFFRTIRKILKDLKPMTQNYDRWFENFVWNNLFPVSPYKGGNAEGKLQDAQLQVCKKLLLQQIDFYKPTHILFITDWEYWFERFADVFPEVQKTSDRVKDNVVGCGVYNGIKVVVAIRPDRTRPNKPNEDAFAQDVVKCFDGIQLMN